MRNKGATIYTKGGRILHLNKFTFFKSNPSKALTLAKCEAREW